MPATFGYVGTIVAETANVSRIWFSLTSSPDGSDWVKITKARAWFTMNLETTDQPVHMAQLTLLMESLRSDLLVKVGHGGSQPFHHTVPHDTFEVSGVRVIKSQ